MSAVQDIRVGAGSATLNSSDSSVYCREMSQNISRLYRVRADGLVFVNDLTNGGERGAGLQVLRAALRAARAARKVLVAVVQVQESPEDTARLVSWYRRHMSELTGDVWSDWMSPAPVFSAPGLTVRRSCGKR